jgi:hypothetical protein
MFKPTRWLVGAVVGAAAVTALGAGVVSAKPSGKKDSGVVYAAVTHTVGGTEYIAGEGTDKILGATAITFKAKVSSGAAGTIVATIKPVTLYTSAGELTGTAKVTLTINANGTVSSKGSLTTTKGTGSLRGHSVTATVTGTGTTVAGPYVFHYSGTYK